jgi:hypothetical protein
MDEMRDEAVMKLEQVRGPEVGARPSQQDFCLRDLRQLYWFSIPTSLIIAEPVGGDTLQPRRSPCSRHVRSGATKP